MTAVRIPLPVAVPGDLGPVRLTISLVDAAGLPVLAFCGPGLRTALFDETLTAERVVELTPQTQLALPAGTPTWYVITLASRARAARYQVQVPDSAAVLELGDLVGAAALDPADLTAGRLVPLATGASSGAVLTLDAALAPVWGADSGGGAATWGTIGGTLAAQTDLAGALDARALVSHAAAHANGQADALTPAAIGALSVAADAVRWGTPEQGIEPMPRAFFTSSTPVMNGTLVLTAFTAPPGPATVTSLSFCVTTPAAVGATLVRCGLYRMDDRELTLEQATADDPTLFAVANTVYTRDLAAPVVLTPGQRYGAAVLVTGTTTAPTFAALPTVAAPLMALAPELSAVLWTMPGQTDLPASGTANRSTRALWVRLQ